MLVHYYYDMKYVTYLFSCSGGLEEVEQHQAGAQLLAVTCLVFYLSSLILQLAGSQSFRPVSADAHLSLSSRHMRTRAAIASCNKCLLVGCG